MRQSGLQKLFYLCRKVEQWLISTAVLAIAVLTIVNVICRSLLGFSLASAEELSQFLIILITFAGLSYATGKGRHIRMTALYDQLGPRTRKAMMLLITSSTCVLMLVFAWHSARYVGTVHKLGSESPVLQVPLALVYAIAPVGFALTAIQYGLTVVRNLSAPDVYVSYDHKDEYELLETGGI